MDEFAHEKFAWETMRVDLERRIDGPPVGSAERDVSANEQEKRSKREREKKERTVARHFVSDRCTNEPANWSRI